MDSPTRRQLVVGFLEPVDKNDYSANTQSDWIEDAFTQSLNQLESYTCFFSDHVHALNSQEGNAVLAVKGDTCYVFSHITLSK